MKKQYLREVFENWLKATEERFDGKEVTRKWFRILEQLEKELGDEQAIEIAASANAYLTEEQFAAFEAGFVRGAALKKIMDNEA